MIRRPPRSTLSSSSAASDVYKRQVVDVRKILERSGSTGRIRTADRTLINVDGAREEVGASRSGCRAEIHGVPRLLDARCIASGGCVDSVFVKRRPGSTAVLGLIKIQIDSVAASVEAHHPDVQFIRAGLLGAGGNVAYSHRRAVEGASIRVGRRRTIRFRKDGCIRLRRKLGESVSLVGRNKYSMPSNDDEKLAFDR